MWLSMGELLTIVLIVGVVGVVIGAGCMFLFLAWLTGGTDPKQKKRGGKRECGLKK